MSLSPFLCPLGIILTFGSACVWKCSHGVASHSLRTSCFLFSFVLVIWSKCGWTVTAPSCQQICTWLVIGSSPPANPSMPVHGLWILRLLMPPLYWPQNTILLWVLFPNFSPKILIFDSFFYLLLSTPHVLSGKWQLLELPKSTLCEENKVWSN